MFDVDCLLVCKRGLQPDTNAVLGAKVWKSLGAPVLVHSFRKSGASKHVKAALISEGLAVRLETHY